MTAQQILRFGSPERAGRGARAGGGGRWLRWCRGMRIAHAQRPPPPVTSPLTPDRRPALGVQGCESSKPALPSCARPRQSKQLTMCLEPSQSRALRRAVQRLPAGSLQLPAGAWAGGTGNKQAGCQLPGAAPRIIPRQRTLVTVLRYQGVRGRRRRAAGARSKGRGRVRHVLLDAVQSGTAVQGGAAAAERQSREQGKGTRARGATRIQVTATNSRRRARASAGGRGPAARLRARRGARGPGE